jgi:hypothetical protein
MRVLVKQVENGSIGGFQRMRASYLDQFCRFWYPIDICFFPALGSVSV